MGLYPRTLTVWLYNYIDDIMLMSDFLSDLEGAVPRLLQHLQEKGWAVNSTKVQGPGLSLKFLGVVWSGKTKADPEAVIDKVQAFPTPTTVAVLQEFWGLLGYWRVFILHLAQILKPLHHLV